MSTKEKPTTLAEYIDQLWEERRQETMTEEESHQKHNDELTSPTSFTTTEENRLVMEYMDQANVLNISKRDKRNGKAIRLRKFFKSKRNQQVEVYSKHGNHRIYTQGKVSTIGRDFIMLTNLKNRFWIPYASIDSANIPFDVPNYTNSHQHYIYDNDLRNKLLHDFGKTVAKRDILKQQFFEESLQTNLASWINTWVEIRLNTNEKQSGRIVACQNNYIHLSTFQTNQFIQIRTISYIKTLRMLSIIKHFFLNVFPF
ncbi:hypothetical protein J416_07042 [Gracilibacillus halophilus YIM-C55.5]|uniref:Uncharacterized protein n=1 Tax=Gracilibacillus halophilus YIM-C55.5 TaxID=1308866 RepID=N4WA57_9BACI|nr:hypothetical protein [Gracilibacillus halophilus]ENH97178.1 hypothetical protein J416_07042 [Gracilibacillus halophilus YIM-C55.5]